MLKDELPPSHIKKVVQGSTPRRTIAVMLGFGLLILAWVILIGFGLWYLLLRLK